MDEEDAVLNEERGLEERCMKTAGSDDGGEPVSVDAKTKRGRQLDLLLERTGFGTYHVFLLIGELKQVTVCLKSVLIIIMNVIV